MFTDPEQSIIDGKRASRVARGALGDRISREQYPFDHYADICYYGNGVGCDGEDCWCTCHSEMAPIMETNEEVEEYHSE